MPQKPTIPAISQKKEESAYYLCCGRYSFTHKIAIEFNLQLDFALNIYFILELWATYFFMSFFLF